MEIRNEPGNGNMLICFRELQKYIIIISYLTLKKGFNENGGNNIGTGYNKCIKCYF